MIDLAFKKRKSDTQHAKYIKTTQHGLTRTTDFLNHADVIRQSGKTISSLEAWLLYSFTLPRAKDWDTPVKPT